jgi:hypothetical protein
MRAGAHTRSQTRSHRTHPPTRRRGLGGRGRGRDGEPGGRGQGRAGVCVSVHVGVCVRACVRVHAEQRIAGLRVSPNVSLDVNKDGQV